uniref:Uncharacterized protein n=1 Tax=viral metagenome TaxID=1070528 RepID=A0A6H2A4X6_9ZZZZ
MKTKLSIKDVTPAVKSSVAAYLMARAYAETMRAAVDKIHRAILEESPLTNGHESKHGKPAEMITDPKLTWLCDDEEIMKDYYQESDKRLRAAHLKPDSMPDDHCPALVAEHIQVKTQWLLIECAAEMLGENNPRDFNNQLLCAGLDTHQKFIDLVVGLVVNLPDFKSPL